MKKLYLICDEYTCPSLLSFFQEQAAANGLYLESVTGRNPPVMEPESALIFAPGDPDSMVTPELLEAIVTHTLEGGHLLMLAGGMLSRKTHELSLLASARLLRTLPYGQIGIQRADDPLTSGFDADQLWDEACVFERSVFDDSAFLLSMMVGETAYPIVWTRPWFLGRVYCVGSRLVPSALASYAPILENILHAMVKEG